MSADPSATSPSAVPRARKAPRAAVAPTPPANDAATGPNSNENPDRGPAGGDTSSAMKGQSMSRAIDLTLSEDEVTRLCAAAEVGISAIEPLPNGGTHLVCSTSDGAAKMRRLHGAKLLNGPQKRSPFFVPSLQRQ